MKQDEIIEMARQAGWTGIYSQWISPTERQHLTVPVTIEQIESFAKLVAEAEREALEAELLKLKKGVAANSDYIQGRWDLIGEFQDIIRARGEA